MAICPLCAPTPAPSLLTVHASAHGRVVRVLDEAHHPAFYRWIAVEHVAEFSALDPVARADCLRALDVIEVAMRRHIAPTKVNLASLGNMVAHQHWHVIARYDWDRRFPHSVWSAEPPMAPEAQAIAEQRNRVLLERLPVLDAAIAGALRSASALSA